MLEVDTSGVKRPGAFLGRITSAVRRAAATRLSEVAPGTVLDVGCGNGLFFASLDLATARLVGVDLDPALLQEARRILRDNRVEGVRLAVSHACALPFRDFSMDNVLFLNTLINIPTDPIASSLLTELMRVCKRGGQVLVDIRNAANPLLRARYWHHNRKADFVTRTYHLRQVTGLFEAAGFKRLACDPIGPRFPFGPMAYLLVMRRNSGQNSRGGN